MALNAPDAGPAPVAGDPAQEKFALTEDTLRGGEDAPEDKIERESVKRFAEEFKKARTFDKNIRVQIGKDRGYASGEAISAWAVSTNLIGSIIDILVAVLYARDPDVSIRKPEQVEKDVDPLTQQLPPSQEERDAELFARTAELVVSRLWKSAKLKKRMQRIVRAVLSSGQGWIKVLPETYNTPDPIAQNEFNTLKDNIKRFEAIRQAMQDGQTLMGVEASADDLDAMQAQFNTLLDSLSKRLEVAVCEGITIDVVKAENMQVSTDVELLEDHLEANWNSQLIFIPLDELRVKFPRMTDEDLQQVEKHYLLPPQNANKGAASPANSGSALEAVTSAVSDSTYNTNSEGEIYSTQAQEGAQAFGCVIEKWDHTDNHIYTLVRGCKRWAEEPYQPEWGTSRFYPFFYFSIYEVDGSRAPQSLSARLAKLMDEYSATRSTFRVSRERSIPGIIFNAGMMDDTQATKLKNGMREEYIALKFTEEETDVRTAFAEKPISKIDPRLYDVAPIIQDMERIAGVQEAQQATTSIEKTATEAEIEQAGFTARTSASRDRIEGVLADLAQYTLEIALQMVSMKTAQRICGPGAFWPAGMSLDDIVTMVEVDITAGTTGKPRNRGDREAWATVMPLIKEVQVQLAQLQVSPQGLPLANALKELIRETMLRMGDSTDPERFFPKSPIMPQVPTPGLPGEVGPDGLPVSPDAGGTSAPLTTEASNGTPTASSEAPI